MLALHGITSNALAWGPVAGELEGAVTLVAPDLRGRGRSHELPGPYGMAVHAGDAVALLDHVGAQAAVIVGHSMGAFVAGVTAVRHPERVTRLVLCDGGVALGVPGAREDPEATLERILGPAMARLVRTFPDREAYRDFWREHPALRGAWSPALEEHFDHDLRKTAGGFRPAVAIDAVRQDGAELLVDQETTSAARRLPCRATLLWASGGLLGESPGMYDAERLAAAGLDPERVRVEQVPGANHYTLLLAAKGARAVAAAILAAASATAPAWPAI
ncbi:MAG: alpha/beta fold hydrolase [Thermoleophilaceae bacterium]